MKIQNLFKQKWKPLKEYKDIKGINYPGVYLLAYTSDKICNKKARINDVFYVGMSVSKGGLKQRINQFIVTIEKIRDLHSAGKRFLKEYSNGKAFSKFKTKKKFYVVALSHSCNVHKHSRTSHDLIKMGEVVKFEYVVLAYIKKRTGKEPELNKK